MSRLANKAIQIPEGVTVTIHSEYVEITGKKKTVEIGINHQIKLEKEGNAIRVIKKNEKSKSKVPMVGTMHASLKNMLKGLSEGFTVKLELSGVGFRALAKNNELNLTLGYSHPLVYKLPKDVIVETPSQTEIILSSHDNQRLGQVAAEIRSFRYPECYKGKGVKFAGEVIVLKETKKK
jgi:large subunit ribosomal protein L6